MCFCKPTIRTPFCPDCNTAMFLRIKELTEERDVLLNTQCDFEQRTHCDGTSDYRCGSNHNMTLLKFFRSEVDSLKAERDALKKDAERYRFLRNTGEEYQHMRIFDHRGHLDPEFLDEAIDEYMKETK